MRRSYHSLDSVTMVHLIMPHAVISSFTDVVWTLPQCCWTGSPWKSESSNVIVKEQPVIDIFGFHSCDEVRVGSFGSENLLEFAVTRVQNQFLGPSEVLQVEVFRLKTLIEPVRCANGLSFHLSVRVKEVER
jgi:hypothetical protein